MLYVRFEVCYFPHANLQDYISAFSNFYLFQAVVFVIDSSNHDRLAEAHSELAKLMSEKELKDASLLILANKQVRLKMPEIHSLQSLKYLIAKYVIYRWYNWKIIWFFWPLWLKTLITEEGFLLLIFLHLSTEYLWTYISLPLWDLRFTQWLYAFLMAASPLGKEATSLHRRPAGHTNLFRRGDKQTVPSHIRNQFPVVHFVVG